MSDAPRPTIALLSDGEVLSRSPLEPGRELVVGRTPQCQLVVSDPSVSRMHARIYRQGEQLLLEDMTSANGTFVDGRRVQGTVALRPGHLIRLGQGSSRHPMLLRVEVSAATADPPQDDARTRPIRALPENESGEVTRVEEMPLAAAPEPAPTAVEEPGSTVDEPMPPGLRPHRATTGNSPATGGERRPLPWRPIGWLVAALAVVAGGLYWGSRPPAPPRWGEATVATTVLSPGAEVRVAVPGLQPGQTAISVSVDGWRLDDLEVAEGSLRGTLPSEVAGEGLPLQISHRGETVAAATLDVRPLPQITGMRPSRAEPGDLVRLEVDHLAGWEPVTVTLGDVPAPIVERLPEAVVLRVPPLDLDASSELTVALHAGAQSVSATQPLRVAPRPSGDFEFAFQPGWRPELGAWEIGSAVGPVVYLAAPRPSGDAAPPESVAAVVAGLQRMVDLARQASGVALAVRASGGSFSFVALPPAEEEAVELFRLDRRDLEATAKAYQLPVTPQRLADWQRQVWQDVLAAVVGGQEPELGGDAHRTALAELLELSRVSGGSRPVTSDLERLPPVSRRQLALAFVSPPARLGLLDGRWRGQLENVFYPQMPYRVELLLDLRQQGDRLSGQARGFFTAAGATIEVEPGPVRGRVVGEAPHQLRLSTDLNRPLGRLELEGQMTDEGLVGTFTSAEGNGSWHARRY